MNLQMIYEKLIQLIALCNSIISNGKKIDELPPQNTLNSSSRIHVSINGVSQYISVSQLMTAFGNSNVDRLLYIGDIPPIVSNVLTIPPAGWLIDGVNYSTVVDTDIAVPFTTLDFTRIDIIVADDNGVIYSIQGDESVGIAVAPPLPDNTIYITQVTVTDSDISEVPTPITGFDFIRKDEKAEIEINDTGVIDILFPDQRAICVLTGSVTTIQTVDVDSTTTYQNKKYAFKNHQATPITFEHLSSGGSNPFKFSFPDEVDFVLLPNEVVEFLQVKGTNSIFEYVGKLTFEIDNIDGLQDALNDKASITYVDALVVGLWDDRGTYTVNASGNINYPSSGGSGTAGALLKGDIFTVGGAVVDVSTVNSIKINNGDTIRALVDSPGATNDAQWAIGENNLGYTPVPEARTITINGTTQDLSANRTFTVSGAVISTRKTITSANLATQDVAGFLTYVNGVTSFSIANNEIVKYVVTDTGQVFEIVPNNISVGSGETPLVSSDIIQIERDGTFYISKKIGTGTTGTTSEVFIDSLLVPSRHLRNPCFIEVSMLLKKTIIVSSNFTPRVYVNTSSGTLSGLLMTGRLNTTGIGTFNRGHFLYDGTNIIGANSGLSKTSDYAEMTSGNSSLAVTSTVDNYFNFSSQCNVSGETCTIEWISVKIMYNTQI